MTNATWTRKLGSHIIGSGDVRGEVTFDGGEYNHNYPYIAVYHV